MSDIETEHTLPAGWRWVKLAEVCEVVTGSTPPKDIIRFYGGTIPWVKPDNLDKSMYVEESAEYLTRDGAEVARLLPPGSVLVTCIGNLGKLAIAKTKLATNQQINSLIPSERIDSEYLFFACRTLQQQLKESASVTIVPIVNKASFSALRIPLPPLPEQKRIAAILTEQMAAVEKARIAAEERLKAAKELPAAYLREVFESDEAQGWPKKALGDVALLERGRFSPRPRNDPRYFGGTYPWIQIGEVEASRKYIKHHKGTLNELGLAVSKMFPKGTLVISIAASIGAVGILGFDSCMPDSLVGITPRPGQSDSEFLYYYFLMIRDHLEDIAPQMAQANLKLSMLNPLELSIPSVNTQQSIASMLDEKFTSIGQLQADIQEELDNIKALSAALLRQAFRGDL